MRRPRGTGRPARTWKQAIAQSRPLTEEEATGPIFSFAKDGVPTLSVDSSKDLEADDPTFAGPRVPTPPTDSGS